MRPHRTDHQPTKPHRSVVHTLVQRWGATRTAARPLASPQQPTVPDLRDLDQRVREIGEW